MKIGIPKEIKENEFRIGATPNLVKSLVSAGHQVFIEKDAALSIGFTNEMYEKMGATIVSSAKEAYAQEMIIKVKEVQKQEYPYLKEGQILFCYLHLAPDPEQTKALLDKKVIAIAYETVTDSKGRLPLLAPMSEVAGRLSIQVGATALQLNNGGKGVLLGGIPGVPRAKVLIIGAGVVGTEALRMAVGCEADVTVLDRNIDRLRELDALYGSNIKTLISNVAVLEQELAKADLVIGAVLVTGAKAPKLITKGMLPKMQKGSVIVDVAIDQGGIAETSRATTHANPTYVVDGIIHYCVANMPGACAKTSTEGLSNAIGPFALDIANKGYKKALLDNPHLLNGLNVHLGKVTYKPVAEDLGYTYFDPKAELSK